jgi:hypothetical protein
VLKHQSLAAAAACAVVSLAPGASYAAGVAPVSEAPVDRMVALNKRAFADILSQHFHAAKYWLEEALVIGETAGLENHETTARTYLHLAAVALAGFDDRDEAVRYLDLALKINPNIAITRGLELPGLRSAYLQAREQAGLPPNPDPTAPSFDTFAGTLPEAAPAGDSPPAAAEQEPSAGAEDAAAPVRAAYAAALVDEPDPPARVPAPLFCSLPFDVLPGQDLVVRCLTQKHTHRSSAVFHHRPGGAETPFLDLPMDRSPKGWLVAVVPGGLIAGESLSYYVTAQLPGSQQAIHLGYAETPRSLMVRPEPSSKASEGAGTAASLSPHADSGRAGSTGSRRRAVGSLWFSLALGSGFVYHGRETVDSDSRFRDSNVPVEVEAGLSPASLLQLEPELGYQATRRLSLSLMARYQYAPKEDAEVAKPVAGGKPVLTSAFALYLQARLAFLTVGNLQTYASGGVGFGRSFLAVIDEECEATSCTLDHSDTLHGGNTGLLAGLGAFYHLSPNLGVFVEVKEMVTLPKVMALTELSLGAAFAIRLGHPRAERLAAATGRGAER